MSVSSGFKQLKDEEQQRLLIFMNALRNAQDVFELKILKRLDEVSDLNTVEHDTIRSEAERSHHETLHVLKSENENTRLVVTREEQDTRTHVSKHHAEIQQLVSAGNDRLQSAIVDGAERSLQHSKLQREQTVSTLQDTLSSECKHSEQRLRNESYQTIDFLEAELFRAKLENESNVHREHALTRKVLQDRDREYRAKTLTERQEFRALLDQTLAARDVKVPVEKPEHSAAQRFALDDEAKGRGDEGSHDQSSRKGDTSQGTLRRDHLIEDSKGTPSGTSPVTRDNPPIKQDLEIGQEKANAATLSSSFRTPEVALSSASPEQTPNASNQPGPKPNAASISNANFSYPGKVNVEVVVCALEDLRHSAEQHEMPLPPDVGIDELRQLAEDYNAQSSFFDAYAARWDQARQSRTAATVIPPLEIDSTAANSSPISDKAMIEILEYYRKYFSEAHHDLEMRPNLPSSTRLSRQLAQNPKKRALYLAYIGRRARKRHPDLFEGQAILANDITSKDRQCPHPGCLRDLYNDDELDDHIVFDHVLVEKISVQYSCSQCLGCFSHPDQLEEHVATHATTQRPFG